MDKTFTLRRKLLVWLLLPMVLLWVISAVGIYYIALKFANIAYDRSLFDSTRDLAEQVTVVDGKTSLDLPKVALNILLSDEYDKVYYKVIGRAGEIIAGEPGLPLPVTAIRNDVPIMHDGILHGQKLRIASFYFLPRGEKLDQPALVQVAETLNKRRAMAKEIITVMVLPQLVLILLAALTVWLGVGKGLEPLKRLRHEITMRSHRDLSPVEESDAPQEVWPIIHAINELMNRLGKALEAQQRFIADAAHQLRTPLAGLKTQTGIALRQTDPESLHHSLQQLNTSADRTVRLINQMLALAKVEPGTNRLDDLKMLSLNELAREITMEWVPHALRKDIDLGYEGPGGSVLIKGDRLRIKMLIDNLLDNAIRYSPAGSHVTTRVEENEKIILTVEDNGPGIPLEERGLVFRRFYRILGSNIDGSGLGLAIVQEVANIHGAEVTLSEPVDHNGTFVKVVFPEVS